jgi:branched-chain amino acid transport system permease protein
MPRSARVPANRVFQRCSPVRGASTSYRFRQLTYTKIFILVAAFVGMGLLTYIIKYTKLGRMCRATQQDRKMASILGINTDRVISYVFIIGAAMAALAGVLITMNYGTFDFYAGFVIGIKAFTAAVLGGIGSLPGAMLGGIILGISESLFSGLVNSDYKDVFSFSLLVLVLVFRPQGLLGRLLCRRCKRCLQPPKKPLMSKKAWLSRSLPA